LTISGNSGGNLTLLNFATASFSVGGNFSGQFYDSGPLTTVAISGSLTAAGVLNVGSIGTMTVGGDLAGLVTVAGLLDTLTVTGGTPGKIVVGDVNVITVMAGYGSKVLQVVEDGVERQIQANPVSGEGMPATVHFAFVYDSETAADPQLAIRITDTNPNPRSFNLELVVVNSATAQFNLSLVDSRSNGPTSVGNITVQGDLLMDLTAPEVAPFADLTTGSRAGVVLPSDNIVGLEVSGHLPIGFVDVAGIEGLAFAWLMTAGGAPMTLSNPLGSSSNIQVMWNLLGSYAGLNQAVDAFVVLYTGTASVQLFAHVGPCPDMILARTLTAPAGGNQSQVASVQVISPPTYGVAPLSQTLSSAAATGSAANSPAASSSTGAGVLGSVLPGVATGYTANNSAWSDDAAPMASLSSNNGAAAGTNGALESISGVANKVLLGGNLQVSGSPSDSSSAALTRRIISRNSANLPVRSAGDSAGPAAPQANADGVQHGFDGVAAADSPQALYRAPGASAGADASLAATSGAASSDAAVQGPVTARLAASGPITAVPAVSGLAILGKVMLSAYAMGSAVVLSGWVRDPAGPPAPDFAGVTNTRRRNAPSGTPPTTI
jgi:hypothetical protein